MNVSFDHCQSHQQSTPSISRGMFADDATGAGGHRDQGEYRARQSDHQF